MHLSLEQRERINASIERAAKYWNVPGAAVTVLDGNGVLCRSLYGLRDTARKLPVEEETVFAVGSITKSFTSALAGLMSERGYFRLDQPVREYLPEFRLFDAYASEHITIADFLNHNSGLPSHNLFWHGSYDDRQTLLEKMRYLRPAWGVGRHWFYHNLNYLAAAAIMERVTGRTWEEMLRTELLDPLGMCSVSFGKPGLQGAANHALAYKPGADGVRENPCLHVGACAPAGALNMNCVDLTAWAQFFLNKGRMGETQLIEPKTIGQILAPRCTDANMLPLTLREAPYNLYGLGWVISPYRGVNLLYDGGNIEGYTGICAVMPDEGIGVTILTNLHEANLFLLSVLYEISDALWFSGEGRDWNTFFQEAFTAYLSGAQAAGKQKQSAFDAGRKDALPPSLPLDAYAGRYESPGYGSLQIEKRGDGLAIRYHDNHEILKEDQTGVFPLTHYAEDAFSARFASLGSAYTGIVRFHVAEGRCAGVFVPVEPKVEDELFVRRDA